MNQINKQWCENCECDVNPNGHADRCRPAKDKSVKVSTDYVRRIARVGALLHQMDVAAVGQLLSYDHARIEELVQTTVASRTVHSYVSALEGHQCDGHSIATCVRCSFHAMYNGDFRVMYLDAVFPHCSEFVQGLVREPDWERLFGREWWQHE